MCDNNKNAEFRTKRIYFFFENRLIANVSMSKSLISSLKRSRVRILAVTGAILKPWPENPAPTTQFLIAGWLSKIKCESGVI